MTGRCVTDHYEVRLEGQLDQGWTDWFDGFTLTTESDGTTTLRGGAVDQAALHGLLRRIGDLGVTLLSVNCLATTPRSPHTERTP
ncbi:hypothetical protein ACVXZ4_01735 [Lacisediminihabitans sp. FW035]